MQLQALGYVGIRANDLDEIGRREGGVDDASVPDTIQNAVPEFADFRKRRGIADVHHDNTVGSTDVSDIVVDHDVAVSRV